MRTLIGIVEKSDIRNVLRSLYESDFEFINIWNVDEGSNIDEMLDHAEEVISSLSVTVLKIINEETGEIIAYFGKELYFENSFLTGFFIKKTYRRKDFMLCFFEWLKLIFYGKTVYCNVHKNNRKAVDFLVKNGSVVGEKDLILTFKIETSCLGQQH